MSRTETELPAARRAVTLATTTSQANFLDRGLLRRIWSFLGEAPIVGELWNGEEIYISSRPPVARVRFLDRTAFLKLMLDPVFYFCEGYTEGRIDVEGDIVKLIEESFSLARLPVKPGRLFQWRHRNTRAMSRSNIHHHYDIGNEFYKLWLDSRMVYTCAYFAQPDMTLEEAQVAKLDYVCRKLQLRPGDRVVEAGCGWGSLALHMAANYGVHVRAYNISHEQIAFARESARKQNLSDRVEFVEDDYRNIAGTFDVFASVGMLEHVGVQNYETLGGVIDRCLAPTGRGLIHTIGRHRPMPFDRWLGTRIFPGAHIPALSEMMNIFEPFDLAVLDVENLRLHYAETLRHWLVNFEQAHDKVAAMFDEKFVRAWRLYLASSMAAFTTGYTQLYQVVFNRYQSNVVPATRAYIYESETGSGNGTM